MNGPGFGAVALRGPRKARGHLRLRARGRRLTLLHFLAHEIEPLERRLVRHHEEVGVAAPRLMARKGPMRDGEDVMPTLDCYAARLSKGAPTRTKRTTYNVICLVVAGEGRSTIGDQTFEWSQHDVFTIPHWTFARHEAKLSLIHI